VLAGKVVKQKVDDPLRAVLLVNVSGRILFQKRSFEPVAESPSLTAQTLCCGGHKQLAQRALGLCSRCAFQPSRR
jgi:hypothetical protein